MPDDRVESCVLSAHSTPAKHLRGRLSTLGHSTGGGPAIPPWPDEEQQIPKPGHHTANQGNSNGQGREEDLYFGVI